jgi:hypothetical protein
MSYLGEIAAEARTKGACTVEWYILKNSYFTGDDAIRRVKAWAAENDLHASFDNEEESFTHVKVRSVTFVPKHPAT